MKRILAAALLICLLFLCACNSEHGLIVVTPTLPTSDGGSKTETDVHSPVSSPSTETPLLSTEMPSTETITPSLSTETPVPPSTLTPPSTTTPIPSTPTPPSSTTTPPPTETIIPSTTTPPPTTDTPTPFVPFTIGFTGDISFADSYYNYTTLTDYGAHNYAKREGRTLIELFDPPMLEEMRRVDFLMVNCESSVSDRGAPLGNIGKTYSFRTSTKYASVFADIGADLIGLSNNHVYDFGKDAFLDTIDTFASLGLPTVGAGKTEEEAYAPYYYTNGSMTIAFIATSCAERRSDYYTPVAEGEEPGICGCYDTAKVCEQIRQAKEKADFVIVYPHYGIEYGENTIEEFQRQASYDFIDAGADLVVGTHAHILQGIEAYKGKFIFYNLGNFLFNLRSLRTALLELTFLDEGSYTLRIMPGMQTDGRVKADFGTARGEETLEYLRACSYGIAIDKDGYVYDCNVYDEQ